MAAKIATLKVEILAMIDLEKYAEDNRARI
jgi:hypothetical protein